MTAGRVTAKENCGPAADAQGSATASQEPLTAGCGTGTDCMGTVTECSGTDATDSGTGADGMGTGATGELARWRTDERLSDGLGLVEDIFDEKAPEFDARFLLFVSTLSPTLSL
ncbi:MAG: hypothetical protein V2A54_07680 [Bacteroidota bacterium]